MPTLANEIIGVGPGRDVARGGTRRGAGRASAQPKKLEVRIGWQPPGGAGAIVDALMLEDKTFSKHAARYGYEVTETWREFHAGPPLNEAVPLA